MTEAAGWGRNWRKYVLIAGGTALACLLIGLWYITTDSFQAYVRRRLVAEVERITWEQHVPRPVVAAIVGAAVAGALYGLVHLLLAKNG